MEAVHLNIEGMTCEHCVRAIDNRLRKTPGVRAADNSSVRMDMGNMPQPDCLLFISPDRDLLAFRGADG
jgi:cation transport ATPase